MTSTVHEQRSTRTLAIVIGVAAVALPLALITFAYPQWIFLAGEGACFAVGGEAWYSTGRLVGGVGSLLIAALAIVGIVQGGVARRVGTIVVCAGVALFFISGFASFILFHVGRTPCG